MSALNDDVTVTAIQFFDAAGDGPTWVVEYDEEGNPGEPYEAEALVVHLTPEGGELLAVESEPK